MFTIMSDADLSAGDRGTILYVGGFELPDRNAAAHRVIANARIFRAIGYRVLLLGVAREQPWRGGMPRQVKLEVEGVAGYEIPYPTGMRAWLRRITTCAPVERLLRQAEIADLAGVICYNYPAVAQMRIAALARARGAWAAADCTEWYAASRPRGIASLIRNLDIPLRMRVVNRRMDALITTSPYMTEYYRDAALPVVEIPTLMDDPKVNPDALTVDRSDGVTKLFFAGSGFDPKKVRDSTDGLKERLDWVLEALAFARDRGARFQLDLYGLEEGQYLALFPDHVTLLARLEGAVSFHGRRPRAELLPKLTAAHFSIFFRNQTRTTLAGFPGKFSESIAHGTPVITNALPSAGQYMEEGRTGFSLDISDREAAGARLADICSMQDAQLTAMKQHCATSNLFAYSTFVKPVEDWLDAISARRPQSPMPA